MCGNVGKIRITACEKIKNWTSRTKYARIAIALEKGGK